MNTPRILIIRRARYILPVLYLAGAIPTWLAFARANPDGLANIWIAIYTFPIVILGTFLMHLEFPYVPGGYYVAHGIYFSAAVPAMAVLIFAALLLLERLFRPWVKPEGVAAAAVQGAAGDR